MKYLILFLLQFLFTITTAQSWQSLGNFNDVVRTVYSDSTDNKLYIGGHFKTVNDSIFNGIVYLDSMGFSPMGTGQDFCNNFNCPPIVDIIKFNNEIWSTTLHSPFDGVETGGLIKWNGNSWNSFEYNFYGANNNFAFIRDLEIINDNLYILGGISYVDSFLIRGIAKWDGNSISSLNFPFPFDPTFSDISCVAEYKGELYVAGNFLLEDGNTQIHDILKYDGNTWEKVGNGLVGNNTIIGDMTVYQDELYIVGLIYESEGNLGDGILKWDGENWTDVAGSFNHGALIFDLQIYKDELYAFGSFDMAGNIPVDNMAKWDGEKWCSFPFTFDNRILTSEIHDGKLVIGGAFELIDSDTINSLAIFDGDLIPDFCDTTLVNSSFIEKTNPSISIFPNPVSEVLNISLYDLPLDQETDLLIYNSLGQILMQQQMPTSLKEWNFNLDVSPFPNGIYFIHFKSQDNFLIKEFIVQH